MQFGRAEKSGWGLGGMTLFSARLKNFFAKDFWCRETQKSAKIEL